MYKNFIFSLAFLLCSNMAISYAAPSVEKEEKLNTTRAPQKAEEKSKCLSVCQALDNCKEVYNVCANYCWNDHSCEERCVRHFKSCVEDETKQKCP